MIHAVPGYYTLYPRGPGASAGPMPFGYVMVSRWVGLVEARIWMQNGATHVPAEVGFGGPVYSTLFGAARPGGTGPIRIDFGIRKAALEGSGRSDWRMCARPPANTPIYNVAIHVPDSIPEGKITGPR